MQLIQHAHWNWTVIGILFFVSPANSEEIKGTVFDYAEDTGIGGVAVCLDRKCSLSVSPTTTTDADGNFGLRAAAGKKTLFFDKVGYTLRNGCKEIMIQQGKDGEAHHLLMQDNPVNAGSYFRKAGAMVVNRAKIAKLKLAEAYDAEWRYTRRFALSPQNRIKMAKAILQTDYSAAEAYPGFQEYRKVNDKSLLEMQLDLNERLIKESFMLTPAAVKEIGIGNELMADAILYTLRTSKAEEESKVKFLAQFDRTWQGTKAHVFVRQVYKEAVSPEAPAEITIVVPADATVSFDGNPTHQKGRERSFITPPLKAGKEFHYEVMARWTENGKAVTRTRRVSVTAGSRVRVDFLTPLPKATPELKEEDR